MDTQQTMPPVQAKLNLDKRAKTRATIVSAAFQVIGHEHGRLARIEQIIELAKISRPTFYTYFDNMEELYLALSHELSHEFNDAVIAYASALSNAAETISASTRFYLAKAASDPHWGWGMINISCGSTIFGAETYAGVKVKVQEGMDNGLFTIKDARIGRDMVLGTTLAGMKTILTEADSDGYAESIIRQILVALGVNSAKAEALVNIPIPDVSALG